MRSRERLHPPRRIRAGTAGDRRPGAIVSCAVLSTGPEEWAGVDLESGAFVRARVPGDGVPGDGVPGEWALWDVARFEIGADEEPPDPARPEAVTLAGQPSAVGRLRRAAARRLLAQLAAPDGSRTPLLGTRGPSTAYVDLDISTPSIELVATDARVLSCFAREGGEPSCAFSWGGTTLTLPLLDARARAALRSSPVPLAGAALAAATGGTPRYLLVGLTAVRRGHAPKAVLSIVAKRPSRR
ncbi:MAG TPA: hypothetical protein VND23_11065 [Acidimicrobiales bacterium]|nr:hypothetical protein [Acidimicrobiales bacterium]